MTVGRNVVFEIFYALVGWIFAMIVDGDVLPPEAGDVGSGCEVFGPFNLGGRSQIEDGGDGQVAELLDAVCSYSARIGTSEDVAAPN